MAHAQLSTFDLTPATQPGGIAPAGHWGSRHADGGGAYFPATGSFSLPTLTLASSGSTTGCTRPATAARLVAARSPSSWRLATASPNCFHAARTTRSSSLAIGSTGIGPCGPRTHSGPSARLPIRCCHSAYIAGNGHGQMNGRTVMNAGADSMPFAITVTCERPVSVPNGTLNVVDWIENPVATPKIGRASCRERE